MRTSDDFDVPASGTRQLSRRSVIKAGAHAAWVVPAIQVVGAAPAFAGSNCPPGAPHVHGFTFIRVGTSWDAKGGGKYVLTIQYRIEDSDPCPMTGLTVQLKAPAAWKGIQDHSTDAAYGATKIDDGKGGKGGNNVSDIWQFSPVLESDGHWYVEMKVQASNSQINHGTMKLTASLDGHSESVEFTV